MYTIKKETRIVYSLLCPSIGNKKKGNCPKYIQNKLEMQHQNIHTQNFCVLVRKIIHKQRLVKQDWQDYSMIS